MMKNGHAGEFAGQGEALGNGRQSKALYGLTQAGRHQLLTQRNMRDGKFC